MPTTRSRAPVESVAEEPRTKACQICFYDDDNVVLYGEMLTTGIPVHHYCLLSTQGLPQNGKDSQGHHGFLMKDIKKEVESARPRCSHCRQPGARAVCTHGNRSCGRSYHYPCLAHVGGIMQFCDSFRVFCPRHRPRQHMLLKKLIGKWRRDSMFATDAASGIPELSCPYCMDAIGDDLDCYDIVLGPCCKRGVYHRECVQSHALSAGRYFFRCPMCNDDKKFLDAMLTAGINVPVQDAAWELENGAFQELYQVYEHCDAAVCLCEAGRDHVADSGPYDLKRCTLCGQGATHIACGSFDAAVPDDWICSWCSPAAQADDAASIVAQRPTSPQDTDDASSTRVEPSPSQRRSGGLLPPPISASFGRSFSRNPLSPQQLLPSRTSLSSSHRLSFATGPHPVSYPTPLRPAVSFNWQPPRRSTGSVAGASPGNVDENVSHSSTAWDTPPAVSAQGHRHKSHARGRSLPSCPLQDMSNALSTGTCSARRGKPSTTASDAHFAARARRTPRMPHPSVLSKQAISAPPHFGRMPRRSLLPNPFSLWLSPASATTQSLENIPAACSTPGEPSARAASRLEGAMPSSLVTRLPLLVNSPTAGTSTTDCATLPLDCTSPALPHHLTRSTAQPTMCSTVGGACHDDRRHDNSLPLSGVDSMLPDGRALDLTRSRPCSKTLTRPRSDRGKRRKLCRIPPLQPLKKRRHSKPQRRTKHAAPARVDRSEPLAVCGGRSSYSRQDSDSSASYRRRRLACVLLVRMRKHSRGN